MKIIKSILSGLRNNCALHTLSTKKYICCDEDITWLACVLNYVKSPICKLDTLSVKTGTIHSTNMLHKIILNSKLQKLIIDSCDTLENIVPFFQKETINKLILMRSNIPDTLLENLPNTVHTLSISKCKFENNSSQTLTNFLNNSKAINKLKIKCNQKGFNMEKILQAIKTNDTIRCLTLDTINPTLVDCIGVTNTLQSLDLSGCVYNENLANILQLLRENCTIKKLALSLCKMRTDAFILLHDMLISNTCIQILDISHNIGTYEGAKLIADALIVNETLTNLNLRSNSFSSSGIKSIAYSLSINNTLEAIDISESLIDTRDGHISDDSMLCMAECLKTNTTLKKLSINYDENIHQLIQSNSSITELYIDSFYICQRTSTLKIADALKNNFSITKLHFPSDCTYHYQHLLDRNIETKNNRRFVTTKSVKDTY